MRVDPARLVELARSTEDACAGLVEDWQDTSDLLRGACSGIGNADDAALVRLSYDDALAAADAAVASLVGALHAGVAAVLDAARDAATADEAVETHLHQVRGHGAQQVSGPGGHGPSLGADGRDGGS